MRLKQEVVFVKRITAYLWAALASLALCCVVLFVPFGAEALWHRPCVNVYSVFALAFFVMNTIGLCVFARGTNVFAKPYTTERPVIEEKKNHAIAVVLAFLEVPMLMTAFFINGGWKMVVCSALFIGGSLILGALIGEISVSKMRASICEQEQRELSEQLQKEEG